MTFRMKVTHGLANTTPRPYPVATIGNFDGQHRGHQMLLETVVRTAQHAGGTALVLTFDPHPVRILAPHVDLRFLTTPEEKLKRFEDVGIQDVVFVEFTADFAALTPEQFVENILHRGLGVRELFVGEHFAFGKGRSGTVSDLIKLGEGMNMVVHPMQPITIGGEVVSATRVRQLIQGGDVAKAARFLGRAYVLGGTVIHGDQRGQTLGWPTANIRPPGDRVVPADGVYAATARWCDQVTDSVVYVGTRPTFDAGERLIEVYLLDKSINLYGEHLLVQFVERLRGDVTFRSADELNARIQLDVNQARASLRRAIQPVGDA